MLPNAMKTSPHFHKLFFPTRCHCDTISRRARTSQRLPTQPSLGQTSSNGGLFRRGQTKDHKIGNRLINARGETLAEKPSFRTAFKRRRCLIPATGFYEWQRNPDSRTKTPMHIALKSGAPFAFAGLWESWHSPAGQSIQSCTIITTEPNDLMAPIHDRMPVILPPDAYNHWLDPAERTDLQDLLVPYSAQEMIAHPVSTLVNSPINDTPDCLKPAQPPEQGALF